MSPVLVLPAGKAALLRHGRRVLYLLGPFRFSPDTATLPSPYSESGVAGSLTSVQTGGQFSTSGGALAFPGQASPTWGNLGFYGLGASGSPLARVAGRALLFTTTKSSSNEWIAGCGSTTSLVLTTAAGAYLYRNGTTYSAYVGSAFINLGVTAPANGVASVAAIIQRGTGAFVMADGVLLWVDNTIAGSFYPKFSDYNAVGTIQGGGPGVGPRVVDLPGAWASDYGIATQRLAGARSAGDTFSHAANALIEWTETTIPSAGTTDLRFRVQDASNYWQITISSTGTLVLNEVVAGTPTQRGTAAAAVANGNRVVVIADGTTIKVYVANVLKITYSSASNFQTQTSGVLQALGTSEAISDIICWPRQVALPAGY